MIVVSLPRSSLNLSIIFDLRGKPNDARGLSYRLRKYGVKPKQMKINGTNWRGYERCELQDPWSRYVVEFSDNGLSEKAATNATSATD